MEKKIVRTGLYSFILSLLIGVLLFKESQTFHEGTGIVTIVYDNLMPYIFKLVRFSAIVTILAVIIAGLDSKNLLVTNEQNKLSIVKLVCVALCVGLAAFWIVIGVYDN
jgi:hypothetical protein